MNVNEALIKAHQQLSDCSVQFLDFVQQYPGGQNAENYYLLELNDPLFKLQPWPTFVDNRALEEIKEASVSVFDVIRSIPARVFENDPEKISRYYRIGTDLARYLMNGVSDNHLNSLLARGDYILGSSGWKCLEYNVNTNLGGMALSFWESLYLATPAVSEFLQQRQIKVKNRHLYEVLFEGLLNNAVETFPDEEEINIAIVMFSDSAGESWYSKTKYLNSLYEKVLQKKSSSTKTLKGKLIICNYFQLLVSGDSISYNGSKVHQIVEWCLGYIPKEIFELFKEQKVLICNGTIAWILSTKLNLALLSERLDDGLLDGKEKEVVEKHIPWTRKVSTEETRFEGEKIRLDQLIRKYREKFVLKPLLGTGGNDIFVGRYTPEEKWNQLIDHALKAENWEELDFAVPENESQWKNFVQKALQVKSWTVQEYVDSPTYLYQAGSNGCAEHHAVWGFFVFGNTYAGAWARVQPLAGQTGVINCHQGAKVSVVFEVD